LATLGGATKNRNDPIGVTQPRQVRKAKLHHNTVGTMEYKHCQCKWAFKGQLLKGKQEHFLEQK
jgi:hypothetical protein